jgi:hypothetical protein
MVCTLVLEAIQFKNCCSYKYENKPKNNAPSAAAAAKIN